MSFAEPRIGRRERLPYNFFSQHNRAFNSAAGDGGSYSDGDRYATKFCNALNFSNARPDSISSRAIAIPPFISLAKPDTTNPAAAFAITKSCFGPSLPASENSHDRFSIRPGIPAR